MYSFVFIHGYFLCSQGQTEVPGLGTLRQIAVETVLMCSPTFKVCSCSTALMFVSSLSTHGAPSLLRPSLMVSIGRFKHLISIRPAACPARRTVLVSCWRGNG